MCKQTLSDQQARAIRELLSSIHPDFAVTISTMLQHQMETTGVRNPVAFVRYQALAVRRGRHGENRGLIIRRTKSAVTGTNRQLSGNGQMEG